MQLAIKLFATTHFRNFLSRNRANISAGQSWHLVHVITLKYENSSPLAFFCCDFSFPPFLLSSKAPMIEQHALYRAKTKVNSLKLNNPLETHKNGNYFIGPLHLLLPSPHLGHSSFRNFLVYDRRL